MIRLTDVRKHFRSDMLRRKREVIRGMNLHVRPAETYALLGANGAGKTTTMKLMLDLIRPDSGSIRIRGIPASDPSSRSHLGYLPEQPYFFPHLTGGELVRYYGRLSGLGAAEVSAAADPLLKRLGLAGAQSRKIRTYSKGMMQRLGFAQVLVAAPEILVLDEPFSGLDPVGRRDIRELLLEYKERKKTILFSSHILEDVERICDKAGFLVDGRIRSEVATGSADLFEILAEGVDPASIEDAELVVGQITGTGENLQIQLRGEEDLLRVQEVVNRRGGKIVSVNRKSGSLEKLFVENVLSREGEES